VTDPAKALERYARFFEELTPADLDRLDEWFSPRARFVDPFNDVCGVDAIRDVFEHMFRTCATVRFEVLECVSGDGVGYLRWRFHFRLRGDGSDRRPVDGVSRVELGGDGRVAAHEDFWDAAGGLYEQFPVIGALMRWLRNRLAV